MINSLLLLAAVTASAQTPADLDRQLTAAFDKTAAAAAKAAPSSCSDAKPLEVPFEMTITFADGRTVSQRFEYAGCEEEGRNDYLPPYTTRSYKGQDGYALTIITEESKEASEVLLSQGRDWVGRFGSIDNAKLISGDSLAVGGVELKAGAKGKAVLRDAAVPLYPQLKMCEAAVTKELGVALRGLDNRPIKGYDARRPALVLLTDTDAYYYHEDCDICAEVTKCALKSGAVSSLIVAHMVNCADMAPYSKNAAYDACAPR